MSLFRKVVLYALILLAFGVITSQGAPVWGQTGEVRDRLESDSSQDSSPIHFVWSQQSLLDWSQSAFTQTTPESMTWETIEAGEFDNYHRDRYATELAVFDADGDGDPDIATAEFATNYLYLNNGKGEFTQAEAGDFDDKDKVRDNDILLVVDVDNDGDEDILTDGKQLFLNNGAGEFTLTDAGALSRYEYSIYKMVALDADSDGDIDVAITSYRESALFVNDGSGKFTLQDAGEFDDGSDRGSTLLAFDANGDGAPDLLEGPGQLYLNDGSGHFTHTNAGEFDQIEARINTIISVDVDGDGDIDLIVGKSWTSSAPVLLIFANDGTGRFEKISPDVPVEETTTISQLSAFDADNDGDVDLIVTQTDYDKKSKLITRRKKFYLNDGAGRFSEISPGALGEIDSILDMEPLDADGDGVTELAVSTFYGNLLLRNRLLDDVCIRLDYHGFDRSDRFGKIRYGDSVIAIFDADGDSDQDILLGSPPALLLNDGHGQYTEGDGHAFDNVEADALLAFDADGDGDIDVAVGNDDPFFPNILLLNDGGGGFSPHEAGDFDDDPKLTATDMTAFDADGDGDLDLAVVPGRPTQGLFFNDGHGLFMLAEAGDFESRLTDSVIMAFDVDGDGDMDLATGGDDDSRLYLNDGAGHFTRFYPGDFDQPPKSSDLTSLVAFDADGDGDLDLAASYIRWGHPNRDIFYRNDGNGVLKEVESGDFDDEKEDITYDLAAADVDGDGDMDLIAIKGKRYGIDPGRPNSLFLNDGQGYFTRVDSGDLTTNRQQTLYVRAFDSDGDGDDDLVTLNRHGPHRQYLNDGQGHFTFAEAGVLDDASDSNTIVAFDADEDGDLDLAVGNWGPNEFYLNNGDGTYMPVDAGDFTAADVNTSQLLAVDINRDGHTDLVAGVFAGANRIYLGDGRGGFTMADAGEFDDASARTHALALLDVEGDGDLDLAVGNFGEPNALYVNNGTGRFRRVDAGAFDDDDSLTMALAAFDADGDGDLDLAEGNSNDGYDSESEQARKNRLFLNDGTGQFTLVDAGDFSASSHRTYALLPVDLDGDGDIDLAETAMMENGLYFNNGSGYFTSPETSEFFDGFNYPKGIVALDAEDDGDIDLLVGNQGIYINDGNGVLHREVAGDFTDGWRAITALVAFDADGDGDTDVAEAVFGEDAQYLNRGLYETGVVTSPVITSYSELCPTCPGAFVWDTLEVAEDLAPHTQITYDILDADADEPIPGYSDLQPDATGRIDLGGIDTAQHPAIRLRAHLADLDAGSDNDDQSPRLCAWSVSYSFPDLNQPLYLPMVVR